MTLAQETALGADLGDAHWTVRQGDAWDLAATLAPASVDMVITSPPYWGLRSYGHDHNADTHRKWADLGNQGTDLPGYAWYRKTGGILGLEPFPSWFVAHLVEFFDALEPALTASGSLWVNLGDTYFGRWSSIRDEGRQGLGDAGRLRRVTPSGGVLHDKQLLMIPARFAIAMQERGWILRNDVIWSKPHVAPRPEKDRLRLTHEHLFHFVRRRPSGRPSYFYDLSEVESGARDVVEVPPGRSDLKHSATFPLELVRPRIRSSSPAGGTVLDPFCGTGTALVAAIQEGRDAIGFELSNTYAEVARRRLAMCAPGEGGDTHSEGDIYDQ